MTINEFMTSDHRACDEEFTECESLVDQQKWDDALATFTKFKTHMLHHFEMEESVMFPEFNESAGDGCNPTGVMIMEHDQMRGIFDQMGLALDSKDKDKFLGLSENLLFVMGQHNMKEEQIMYTMVDNELDAAQTLEKMKMV